MTCIPGDLVHFADRDQRVVVDVATIPDDDGQPTRWAVLRRHDDLDGEDLVARPADDLYVVDHLKVPGWIEIRPGEWRRA